MMFALLRSLVMPALCVSGVVTTVAMTAGLRSCAEGRAAAVALEQTRAALEVSARNGRAAVDASERACESVRRARDGHKARLEALRAVQGDAGVHRPSAGRDAESPPAGTGITSDALCDPDAGVLW